MPGWEVDSRIVLGTFSFSKMAMYEDLERMKSGGGGGGIRNGLVRFLASAGRIPLADLGAGQSMPPEHELAGGGLDDLLDLRDQFAVLPADFSQLMAIEQARKGDNLVIHGPPGTGKSQTIANLIATMIADGKRVLFVSEKTAALDVVKRRLEECDLGVFCLDLHSDRGRRSEVYRQLQESLDDERSIDAGESATAQLVERREHLNSVTRLLHEKRNPLGLSIFEVQGRFAKLRDHLRFEALAPPPYERLTGEWLNRAVAAAQGIALRPGEFAEHHTSRWRALRTSNHALALSDLIREDMQAVLAAVEQIRSAAEPVAQFVGASEIRSTAEALGEPQATTRADIESAADCGARVLALEPVPEHWLEPHNLRDEEAKCAGWRELADRLSRDEAKLRGDFSDDLVALVDEQMLIRFASYFTGAATDWEQVGRALDWTKRFLDAADRPLTDALGHHATDPMAPDEYSVRAEVLEMALGRYAENLSVLDQRFDVSETDWRSGWQAAPLQDIESWATELRDSADGAPGWVQYKDAVATLDQRVGEGSTDALRALTDRAEDGPAIIQRRILETWLENVYQTEPELGTLNRIDHETIRENFRSLDESFPKAARARVREQGFRRYPEVESPSVGGLVTLKGELAKRRGRKSTRWLMKKCPDVIQRLKPCFMMSPLAVSQYLSSDSPEEGPASFDVVIFDEASQVFPEEAIPAMERAKQVIVAGDRQQLPPTRFFLADGGDDCDGDDDDDSDDNLVEGRESILDVVALSRAQADLIEDLIDHGRLERRHLDERFREDRHERFFVKNLENVQGDERDHMILCVGYGPTPAGAELDAGLVAVARWTFGAEQQALVQETSRQFGWRRVEDNIQHRLDSRIESLAGQGRLLRRGDTLVAAEDDPAAR